MAFRFLATMRQIRRFPVSFFSHFSREDNRVPGMAQFLAGMLTGEPAGGKLQPGPVESTSPVFVRISVAGIGIHLVGYAIQGYMPLEEASDPLPVPEAVQGM